MKIKATELVWDTTIYPREDVSSVQISSMVDSLRLGETLPPIIADEKTKAIIDGVHRWHAYRRFAGDDCLIECTLQQFETSADMFIAAMRTNSAHGLNMTPFEKKKCVLRALELNISREVITEALRISPETWDRFKATTAYRDDGAGNKIPIALKGSMADLSGKTLNKRQLEANEYAGGMPPTYYVNLLINLLEAGLASRASETLRDRLQKLHSLLESKLMQKV